jgi:hypothetical protein
MRIQSADAHSPRTASPLPFPERPPHRSPSNFNGAPPSEPLPHRLTAPPPLPSPPYKRRPAPRYSSRLLPLSLRSHSAAVGAPPPQSAAPPRSAPLAPLPPFRAPRWVSLVLLFISVLSQSRLMAGRPCLAVAGEPSGEFVARRCCPPPPFCCLVLLAAWSWANGPDPPKRLCQTKSY